MAGSCVSYISSICVRRAANVVSNLLHLRSDSEGRNELLCVRLVLGEVEERRLRLVLGEEPEMQRVEAEPVRHSGGVVLMSIGLGNLRVNVIVKNALINLSRGHLGMIDLTEYTIYVSSYLFRLPAKPEERRLS